MSERYRSDERWPALGMGSRDAYVQAYVFAGRFHAGVPRDVVQAYETVSHPMAQAWYHYPLYDEALDGRKQASVTVMVLLLAA